VELMELTGAIGATAGAAFAAYLKVRKETKSLSQRLTEDIERCNNDRRELERDLAVIRSDSQRQSKQLDEQQQQMTGMQAVIETLTKIIGRDLDAARRDR
jgi:chromosome segregation ATPase